MRSACKAAVFRAAVPEEHPSVDDQITRIEEQVARLTSLIEKGLTGTAPTVHNHTNIGFIQQNLHVNLVGFNRADRIQVPLSAIQEAFSTNPRLIEYCRMTDEDRTDADKATPYIVEALVDLVRLAHRDPIYRNVYLNPHRADQVMVCLDDEKGVPRQWEVRPLVDAIRLLFDGVVINLRDVILSEAKWKDLPINIQGAAAWLPNMYEGSPERYVDEGRQAMAAHLMNTRPDPPK